MVRPTLWFYSAYNIETFDVAADDRLLVAWCKFEPCTHPLDVVVG